MILKDVSSSYDYLKLGWWILIQVENEFCFPWMQKRPTTKGSYASWPAFSFQLYYQIVVWTVVCTRPTSFPANLCILCCLVTLFLIIFHMVHWYVAKDEVLMLMSNGWLRLFSCRSIVWGPCQRHAIHVFYMEPSLSPSTSPMFLSLFVSLGFGWTEYVARHLNWYKILKHSVTCCLKLNIKISLYPRLTLYSFYIVCTKQALLYLVNVLYSPHSICNVLKYALVDDAWLQSINCALLSNKGCKYNLFCIFISVSTNPDIFYG